DPTGSKGGTLAQRPQRTRSRRTRSEAVVSRCGLQYPERPVSWSDLECRPASPSTLIYEAVPGTLLVSRQPSPEGSASRFPMRGPSEENESDDESLRKRMTESIFPDICTWQY